MGIKYTREYKTIIDELTLSIMQIDNFYEFFEMSVEDWKLMEDSEKKECARTLADDIFYGLGEESNLEVGQGVVNYNKEREVIEVINKNTSINSVRLIDNI
jgi:hypothetical protein